MKILEIFLSAYPNAFSVMQATARVDSDDMEIFSYTHRAIASRAQITQWISQAWDQVSDLTPCRRISQVMTSMKTATQSSDTVAVYNDAVTRVSNLLGKNRRVTTTGTPRTGRSVPTSSSRRS